jgi:hypothetical protein
VCDLTNLVLMAWPQKHKEQPKSGKWYVKDQLNSPCPLYKDEKDRPIKGGVRAQVWKMDFTKTVDEWPSMWSWYNAMDHFLAYALLDHLGARAAELDGLDRDADVLRYQLDLLDAVRDLPDTNFKRRDRGFAVEKDGSDPDIETTRPWALVIDYAMYVKFKKRREYKLSISRRHRMDLSHFEEEYVTCLELALGTSIKEWDKYHTTDHNRAFNMIGSHFPHACACCGSFEHGVDDCKDKGEKYCLYPPCHSSEHDISVCPMVTARCSGCGGLGHEDHNTWTTTRLAEHFNAAKHVHLTACRLNNNRLAYKVVEDPGELAMEVIEVESPYSASLKR